MSATPHPDAVDAANYETMRARQVALRDFARTLERELARCRLAHAKQLEYWLSIGDRFHAPEENLELEDRVKRLRALDQHTPEDLA
jgi:hypothetical protein